jgi:hypothetical protein
VKGEETNLRRFTFRWRVCLTLFISLAGLGATTQATSTARDVPFVFYGLQAGLASAAPPAGAAAVNPLAPVVPLTGTETVYLPVIFRDYPVDLAVSRVEVIQGITMDDSRTVHIAGRLTMVRVFVNVTGVASVGGVSGRLTRYLGGMPQDSLDAGPITANASINEGNLAHTLNFTLPPNWVVAGTSYVLEIDPLNVIGEGVESNNRHPAVGELSFNFVDADALEVVIVPIPYQRNGTGPVTMPKTNDLSYLTWMPIKVYPVSVVTYTLHPPVATFTGDLTTLSGWEQLLTSIHSIHNAEDPDWEKVYFGLVNSGCGGSCIAGLGYLGAPTAIGFSGTTDGNNNASSTFTHEMGHNFNRRHAPGCGAGGVDSSYPPAYVIGGQASIGLWGYDPATTTLYNPAVYRDYMSYCGPEWTSDYTYKAIYDFRAAASFDLATAQSATAALYVGGRIDEQGQVHLLPLNLNTAPVHAASTGTHRVELLDAGANVLASQPFDLTPVAFDTLGGGGEGRGFGFFMPAVDDVAALRIYEGDRIVFERRASGPAPQIEAGPQSLSMDGTSVSWVMRAGNAEVRYRIRFSPDGGQTWQVLALDASQATWTVPPDLLAGAVQPVLEVQAMDGVRTDTVLIPLEHGQAAPVRAGPD